MLAMGVREAGGANCAKHAATGLAAELPAARAKRRLKHQPAEERANASRRFRARFSSEGVSGA